jgi:hypothetical protein
MFLQEYGECMADMPPGMKINFDEQNMTKWEVLLDGPDQSAYAVCPLCMGGMELLLIKPGRPFQARD